MNSKRQTIWLVSMLSLMVVLSAYYLFTDDVDKLNSASDQIPTEQVDVASEPKDITDVTAGAADKNISNTIDPIQSITDIADANANASKDAEAAQADVGESKGDAADAADATNGQVAVGDTDKSALTDAEILKKVEDQEQDFFTFQQLANKEELDKKMDSLGTLMANSQESVAVQTKAYDDYTILEDQQSRQTRIEEQLLKDGYGNVVLLSEGGKWRVVVASEKLEKSQAVSILDLVTKELKVAPDKVMVQYRKN
ncbi:MAG: SpoIIIAH-like family protein [Gorillibacterium sp.]|nr:SpoIIIAH-like family protein [Gorillibacterium sp.]